MAPNQKAESSFAVFAESDGHNHPLIMTNLSFARLIDDVVVPYESGQAFFVDGASVTKDTTKRLKIIRQSEFFNTVFGDLHHQMRWGGDLKRQQLYAEQYHIRIEALLREAGEDVTSQVIKAFDRTIRPSLRDYIPKREELISGALSVFVEGMKLLGKSE